MSLPMPELCRLSVTTASVFPTFFVLIPLFFLIAIYLSCVLSISPSGDFLDFIVPCNRVIAFFPTTVAQKPVIVCSRGQLMALKPEQLSKQLLFQRSNGNSIRTEYEEEIKWCQKAQIVLCFYFYFFCSTATLTER